MFSRGIILGGKAILLFIVAASLGLAQANAAGDAERGQRVFRQCAACHSLEPRRHLTGPSLARIWKRKAGTIEGFPQYSDALKKSGIVGQEITGTHPAICFLGQSRARSGEANP